MNITCYPEKSATCHANEIKYIFLTGALFLAKSRFIEAAAGMYKSAYK